MHSKFRVLFLSSRNSDRGIFAEYILRSLGSDRFEVQSGGAAPTGEVNPLVLKILRETFKIDATGARSKSLQEFKDADFDFVITVSDDAHEPGLPWCARHRPLEHPGSDGVGRFGRRKIRAPFTGRSPT
jgi:arsenate reductase (thioredoxin)